MSGSFTQNAYEVFPLGPCKVTFGSNLMGHTDDTTKFSLKASIVEAMVAKYGKAAVGFYLNGQQGEVDCVFMQNDMTILATAFPGATLVTNVAGASKITFGMTAGVAIPSAALVLTPEQGTNNPAILDVSFHVLASPVGDFDAVYDGGKVSGFKAKFKVVINESGASNGSWVGTFGDPTITALATAPMVSGVVPANAATGVTSGTVVATISQSLYGPDVNLDSVGVIEDPTGTPTLLAGTVALVNAGSSTTITFTLAGGGNFTASKSYTFFINNSVRNQNLVPFAAAFLSHFAT